MLLRELSDTGDDTGRIELRPRVDQMPVMHNDVADIYAGVFGKKFLVEGCIEMLVTYFCWRFHSHQALSSRWPPLCATLDLSDTCRRLRYPSPLHANTFNLTVGCAAHVFQKYSNTSRLSPGCRCRPGAFISSYWPESKRSFANRCYSAVCDRSWASSSLVIVCFLETTL